MKETEIAQYANGFSLLTSRESGEMVITLLQNQPTFDARKNEYINNPREVYTFIIPIDLGQKLASSITDALKTESNK